MTSPALTIGTTEYRRKFRIVVGNRTKLLLMLAVAVFALGPMLVFGSLLLPAVGESVAAGNVVAFETITATDVATGGTALLWFGLFALATVRTVSSVGDLDEPACVLVSSPLSAVVVGLVFGEMLAFLTWLVPITLVLSGAFAYGAGTLWPVVVALPFVVVLFCSAFPAGFVVGIGIRHLLTVYEPVARFRTPLLVLVGVAYFGTIAFGQFDRVMTFLFDLFSGSPLGWPGHLLLFGVPNVSPSVVLAGGSLALTGVLAVVAIRAGTWLTSFHWFADPYRKPTDTVPASEPTSSRLSAVLGMGLGRPVTTVALTAIRRAKRAPIRLLYVAYPLFMAAFFVDEIARTGTLPASLAVLCCLYVVWGAGALFTLNPLGDLGPALPTVLTSTVTGRQAVTGHIVAGTVVSVPIAIVVSLAVGLLSPLSLEQTAVLLVGTVIGTIASPALATGVGTVFPRFGSVKLTSKREAVMPSKTAFVVYTLCILIPAGAAAVLYADAAEPMAATATAVLSLSPVGSITVAASRISLAAWIALPAGLLAPLASAGYAVERFDTYVQ
ncbi:hypothetical protein ACLI4U_09335 [Natrialbaceae archaeon A-CW2]